MKVGAEAGEAVDGVLARWKSHLVNLVPYGSV